MNRLSDEQLSAIDREVVLGSGRRVVLLDVSGRKDVPLDQHTRNIYCIDENGNVLWQVQAADTTYERDSFVSLDVDASGKLRADRFFGNEFQIDPDRGIATVVGWHK